MTNFIVRVGVLHSQTLFKTALKNQKTVFVVFLFEILDAFIW